MRNIKLIIEYDGTDFLGWQIQKEGRTVQQVIKDVLEKLMNGSVNLIGAGRTDSGVHARGQVANFITQSDRELRIIKRALNDLLPEDIRIHDVSEAPLNFNSRYDATERTYRYYISLSQKALNRKYSLFCYYKLDFDLLNQCGEYIKTVNNFKSFCYSKSEVKHHLCKIANAFWIKNGDEIIFEISANRFLHGMVRSLTGTMLDVSRGKISYEYFKEIFDKQDRRFATKSVPPQGLVLENVKYPDFEQVKNNL
jgi:tRNA pseudouridine38-40 synthase